MKNIMYLLVILLLETSAYAGECDEKLNKIENIKDVKDYLSCVEKRVPTGAIFSWDAIERKADGTPTGTTRPIPQGWQVCNGTNGTPNLTDRFLKGVTSISEAGKYGGSPDIATSGEHTHSGETASASGPDHGIPCSGKCGGYRTSTHSHSFSTSANGAHSHGSNLPPYYQILYICKTGNVLN